MLVTVGAAVVVTANGSMADPWVAVVASADVIVGALTTRRAVTFDRDGSVVVAARRFEVGATERIVLHTARAYVQVKAAEVEVYGHRVITRAREVARTLARLVSLN